MNKDTTLDKLLKKYKRLGRKYAAEVREHIITTGDCADAWDLVRAAEKEIKHLKRLLEVANCPACDGSGGIPHHVQISDYREVTRDMAMDAGDPSLEGSVYSYEEWDEELEQCQWCDERKKLLK